MVTGVAVIGTFATVMPHAPLVPRAIFALTNLTNGDGVCGGPGLSIHHLPTSRVSGAQCAGRGEGRSGSTSEGWAHHPR